MAKTKVENTKYWREYEAVWYTACGREYELLLRKTV